MRNGKRGRYTLEFKQEASACRVGPEHCVGSTQFGSSGADAVELGQGASRGQAEGGSGQGWGDGRADERYQPTDHQTLPGSRTSPPAPRRQTGTTVARRPRDTATPAPACADLHTRAPWTRLQRSPASPAAAASRCDEPCDAACAERADQPPESSR